MGTLTSDVVVIGGGVVGTSIAYHLARRGAGVTPLERDRLASQASGATAGGVRQVNRDSREVPLAIASIRRWHTLEDELEADVENRMGGQLSVADNERNAILLSEKVAREQEFGVEARFVDGPELRELAPHLAPRFKWGMHTANDGQAGGSLTTEAFGAAAARLGAKIRAGLTVISIAHAGDRVVGVETDGRRITCDWLIVAAGAWSRKLVQSVGFHLPTTMMALQMISVGPGEATLAPTLGALDCRLSLKQTPGGSFVIGGGWPGNVDTERRVGTSRLDSIRGSIEHATAILPPFGHSHSSVYGPASRRWRWTACRSLDRYLNMRTRRWLRDSRVTDSPSVPSSGS